MTRYLWYALGVSVLVFGFLLAGLAIRGGAQ